MDDSVDAMPEPPRVILLRPSKEDAPAISFNQHVCEPIDATSDHEPEPKALAAPEPAAAPAAPQRAPLAPLPSRSKKLAKLADDREARAAQRNALLQNSDDADNNDPLAQLSAYVNASYSES